MVDSECSIELDYVCSQAEGLDSKDNRQPLRPSRPCSLVGYVFSKLSVSPLCPPQASGCRVLGILSIRTLLCLWAASCHFLSFIVTGLSSMERFWKKLKIGAGQEVAKPLDWPCAKRGPHRFVGALP